MAQPPLCGIFAGKERPGPFLQLIAHGAEAPIHIGLDKTIVDSMFLVWPDNTFERIEPKQKTRNLSFTYHKYLPKFDYSIITTHWKNPLKPMRDITSEVNLLYKHKENDFHEFDREPLIPHMLSTEGPALAVSDINHDGLEDVFIGSSKWQQSAIFLQQKNGKSSRGPRPSLRVLQLLQSAFHDQDDARSGVRDRGTCLQHARTSGGRMIGWGAFLR
jgi:hypothetical protein